MKLFRCKRGVEAAWGIREGDAEYSLTGDPFGEFKKGDALSVPPEDYLCPVQPGKIIGIGVNYYDFIESIGFPKPDAPYIFYKPASSLLASGKTILLPNAEDTVTFEAELAVVIGRQCKNVDESDVDRVILGYTTANDVTNKACFAADGHMGRAKSFDTFTPVGRYIETGLTAKEAGRLAITLRQNGVLMQDSNTSNMIFPVQYLVSYLSRIMTLMPGDLILTGAPKGPAPMRSGDVIDISLDKVGDQRNTVCLQAAI